MELTLIGAEDVRETIQPIEKTIPKEEVILEEEKEEINDFQVSKKLTEVLEDVFDLTTGGMEMHGFKNHALMHPTEDYDVAYFVKGPNVIMVDYHGANSVKIEVLGRKEADLVINTINGGC